MAVKSWVSQTFFPELSQLDSSHTRMLNFVLGTLYGSGLSPIDLIRRSREVVPVEGGGVKDLAKDTFNVFKFIADHLNTHLGQLTSEDFDACPVAKNGELSQIVQDALSSPELIHGIKYPETLNFLEENNILSKQDFTAICNLSVQIDGQISSLAKRLEAQESDEEMRLKIRQEMADLNNDSVGMILAVFTHILAPASKSQGSLVENGALTLDSFRKTYPTQMAIGHAWQASFSTLMCVNRIVREYQEGIVISDPVINKLEENGQYTTELKDEILKLSTQYRHKKFIPKDQLPQPLRDAIDAVKKDVMEQVDQIPDIDPLKQKTYEIVTRLNARMGPCNGVVGRQMQGVEPTR